MPGFILLWCWVRLFGRLPRRALYLITGPRRGVGLVRLAAPAGGDAGAHGPAPARRRRPSASARAPARGCLRTAYRYWADLAWAAHRPAGAGGRPRRGDRRRRALLHRARPRLRRRLRLRAPRQPGAHDPHSWGDGHRRGGSDGAASRHPRCIASCHKVASGAGRALRAGGQCAACARRSSSCAAAGAVAILADRDVLGSGQPQPFFGEPARLPRGPIELALRANADVRRRLRAEYGAGRRAHQHRSAAGAAAQAGTARRTRPRAWT